MLKKNRQVIILGAGISGLGAAWRLAAEGLPVTVLEASPGPGGLAGTVRQDGFGLDFGPHSFFTEDEEIREIVLGLFDPPLVPEKRTVKFFYRGKYLDYPFTPLSIARQMGWGALPVAGSWLKEKMLPSVDADPGAESVRDWAVRSFGARLYHSFFKPYTEQFWKISCEELSARAIPSHTRVSFINALKVLFKGNAGGASVLERENLPVHYPRTGYGEIADKLLEKAVSSGAEVRFKSRVTRVENQDGEFHVFCEGESGNSEISGGRVISTIPLPRIASFFELPSGIEDAVRKLCYRPVLVLGMALERENVLPASYIYTLDKPYNRLTDMNKFSPGTSPKGQNILAAEISCGVDDPLFDTDEETLFGLCAPHLEAAGILRRQEVKKLMIARARYAYPVYLKGCEKFPTLVAGYLETHAPGLSLLGRTGTFCYMDADQCLRRAFDLADEILRADKEKNIERAFTG